MGSFPTYQATTCNKRGRIGELRLRRDGQALPPLSTPLLYPVVCFMTGTSPRGGGIWKYILRDFMTHDTPMLSQVLHFLDFNLTAKHIAYWREMPIRQRYSAQNGAYHAPMFLDSGGFKLLYNAGLNLSEYGVSQETAAGDILAFQLDFGGEIIASLDYPLPPGLARAEAEERMQRSLENAFRVAERLAEMSEPPFFYVCCHGQSTADIQDYVQQVFARLTGQLPSFGLAVGSLVPLRGSDDSAVLFRIRDVLDAIPETARDRTPVHAFGVSGNLAPILAYLGVDSFDSTSYIQSARNLGYTDPITQRKLKIMELDAPVCECRICRKMPLEEMQQAFMDARSYYRTSTGKYKSEYYAAIALHNLEMELANLREMREAIEAGDALEGLMRHVSSARGIKEATEWLSAYDTAFAAHNTRTILHMPRRAATYATAEDDGQLPLFQYAPLPTAELTLREGQPTFSLNYTPDAFSVAPDYQPPSGKRVLLTIPCAGKKPYSISRTHTIINTKLFEAFGEAQREIHKVTLSGLYGPVPEEFEAEEAVVRYNFQLSPQNWKQIQLCAARFADYLNRYAEHYTLLVGYATSKAYRTVLEHVQTNHPNLIVLPENPKQKRLSEFFRHIHLDVLIEVLATQLRHV